MSKEKTRIAPAVISSLFPFTSFKITDDFTIALCPMDFNQWAMVIQRIESALDKIKNAGISWDDFNEATDDTADPKANNKKAESVVKLVALIIKEFPDLLSEVSGIHEDDLKQLPVQVLASLTMELISINLKDKDDMIKNFNSLTTAAKTLEKK